MGKQPAFDYGKVKAMRSDMYENHTHVWIIYESKIYQDKRVIYVDRGVHCRKDNIVYVYYLDADAIVWITKGEDDFKDATSRFQQEYHISLEDFEEKSSKERAEVAQENPALVKDAEFLLELDGLPKITPVKIWNEDENVIWHKQ